MYNLRDTVWVMQQNSPIKLKVGAIIITQSSNALTRVPEITYELGRTLFGLERATWQFNDALVFPSKELLLASL